MENKLQKNNVITILFSIFIPLIPILEYYNSPLSMFNMAMFLIIFFFVIFVFNPSGKIRIITPIILFIAFITINILVSFKVQGIEISNTSILSWGRTSFWLLTIFILGSQYLIKILALKR